MNWQKVIGIEVHAQIASKAKLFSRAECSSSGEPNEFVEWIDAGFPGALPSPNRECIYMALRTALALNMEINKISIFDRKHYFYPDLPTGYQISQFYHPIAVNGFIECSFGRVRINRLHIECDAGKTIHEGGSYNSGDCLIDLNRAGVPLMEIVTEPDISSAQEAVEFLKELKSIFLTLGTCDCNMEQGNMRADINLSINKPGEPFGTRVEIKNLNSMSFASKAIEEETKRQAQILESGGEIMQESRLFDSKTGETRGMRKKEDASDYRYFPDPDLLPIELSDEEIETARKTIPELPQASRKRWQEEYNVAKEQCYVLSEHPFRTNFFEALILNLPKPSVARASNFVCSEVIGQLSKIKKSLEDFIKENSQVANEIAKLVDLICENKISGPNAKAALAIYISEPKNMESIIEENQFCGQISEEEITKYLQEAINSSPKEVEKYKAGKTQVLMFFVGHVMKESKGKADPDLAKNICIRLLDEI